MHTDCALDLRGSYLRQENRSDTETEASTDADQCPTRRLVELNNPARSYEIPTSRLSEVTEIRKRP